MTAVNGWGGTTNGAVSIHAGIQGVGIGFLCVPKGTATKLPARAGALTWVSRAIRIQCAFPSTPLIQVRTLPVVSKKINDAEQRLSIVLDRRTVVVAANVTATTSKLGYAKKYCSPVPGNPR